MENVLLVVTIGVVAVQAFVAVGVLFEVARLKAAGARVPALQVGRAAPIVDGLLASTSANVVLLFVTPTCQFCLDLLARLRHDELSRVAVVCHGSSGSCEALRSVDRHRTLYVDDDGAVAELFGVSATPTCVVIRDGVVRAHADVRDEVHLRKLLHNAALETPTLDSADGIAPRHQQAAGAPMKTE